MDQIPDQPGRAGPRRPAIYKDLLLLQLTALAFLLDQFSKFLVRELLEFRESFPEQGFFRFTHTFNTGSAFGLFQDQNFALILASVAGITVLTLIYRGQRRPTNLLRLSLGLQLGGAAGNLLDRLRMGHVTDFVDVGPWPIFNLADAAIVTGLVLLVWMFLMPDAAQRRLSATTGTPEHAGQPGTPSTVEGDADIQALAPGHTVESLEEGSQAPSGPEDLRTQTSAPTSEDRGFPGRCDAPQKGE